MGTLSCLANTLPPRVSSLLKRLFWQPACCWIDGALPRMAHYCSTWPSSLCQEPSKEKGPSRRVSMPRMCSQTHSWEGSRAHGKGENDVEFAPKPPPLPVLFSFSFLLFSSPTSCPPLSLGSEEFREFNPNTQGEVPAPGRSGPSPTSSVSCSHRGHSCGPCCFVLHTGRADPFPGTLVESRSPPQTLKTFPRPRSDY